MSSNSSTTLPATALTKRQTCEIAKLAGYHGSIPGNSPAEWWPFLRDVAQATEEQVMAVLNPPPPVVRESTKVKVTEHQPFSNRVVNHRMTEDEFVNFKKHHPYAFVFDREPNGDTVWKAASVAAALEAAKQNPRPMMIPSPDVGYPGHLEITKSMNTVNRDTWFEVAPQILDSIYADFAWSEELGPPDNWNSQERKEAEESAAEMQKQFGTSVGIKDVAERVLPGLWLDKRMRLDLHLNPTHIKKQGDTYTESLQGTATAGQLWCKVRKDYNGYVRMLKELFKYVPHDASKRGTRKSAQSADEPQIKRQRS